MQNQVDKVRDAFKKKTAKRVTSCKKGGFCLNNSFELFLKGNDNRNISKQT